MKDIVLGFLIGYFIIGGGIFAIINKDIHELSRIITAMCFILVILLIGLYCRLKNDR